MLVEEQHTKSVSQMSGQIGGFNKWWSEQNSVTKHNQHFYVEFHVWNGQNIYFKS